MITATRAEQGYRPSAFTLLDFSVDMASETISEYPPPDTSTNIFAHTSTMCFCYTTHILTEFTQVQICIMDQPQNVVVM